MAKDTTSTKNDNTKTEIKDSSGISMETLQLMLALNAKSDIPLGFTDSLQSTIDEVNEVLNRNHTVNDKPLIRDAYGNPLSSTGTDDKVKSFTNYGFSNDTLNFVLWLSLYNDSWVFRKVIDKPSTRIGAFNKFHIWTRDHVKDYLGRKEAKIWILRVYELDKPQMLKRSNGMLYANVDKPVKLEGEPVIPDEKFNILKEEILNTK